MPWKNGLIDNLTAARGRKICSDTTNGILDQFESLGEAVARKIVRELCLLDNLPTNLCGAIEKQWILFKQLRQDNENFKFNNRESSEADKYPADVMALFGFIEEHQLWHKLGLIELESAVISMDIDTWINKGRPKICCKLHDIWMSGFEKSYKKELIDPESDAIAIFTKAYTKKLQETRAERTKP